MTILKVVVVIVIAIILVGLFILIVGNSSMVNLYNKERLVEVNKFGEIEKKLILEEDIAHLPEPVQRYMNYSGFIGRENMMNAEVKWSDSKIRLKPDQGWMNLKTLQVNSVKEPMRAAYMKGRMFGIPIEVREIFQNGTGNMSGKIAGRFTIFNNNDHEVLESVLLTILSEAPLVPGYLFADYITWEPVDENTAKARLQYKQFDVGGTFYFNDLGEYIRFETNERNYEDRTDGYRKEKWTILVHGYQEKDGIKFPTGVSVIWNLQEGDFEYWTGTITEVIFNVNK